VRTRPIPWLALGLAFLAASTAARIVELPTLSLELSRSQHAHLTPAQDARLAALLSGDTHASIEYWITPRAELPHDLHALEPAVRAAFAARHGAHPERLHLTIHHPTPDQRPHLDSLGLHPTRAPRIADDRTTETELSSSLRFTLDSHPARVRNGLLPAHTADLPELLLTHLEDLARPSRPRVLLDAPDGFVALESLLTSRAILRRANLADSPPTDPDDLIIWVQPAAAPPAALAHLEAHLAAGGDLLLAGSSTTSALGRGADEVILQLSPAPAFARVLSSLGVRARPGVLLDPISAALPLPDGTHLPARHLLTVPATQQDFRPLAGQPNGSLLFDAATALDLNPALLAAHGLRAEVLATAGPRALSATLPPAPLRLSALADLPGSPAPRAPVAALLTPTDPSRGRIFLLSSASPLADAHLADERYQHLLLARVLLDALISGDRHLLRRATTRRTTTLPPLTTPERTRLRLLLILGAPLLLSLLYLSRRGRPSSARLAPRFLPIGALLLIPTLTSLTLAPLGARGLDTTAARHHHLDATSQTFFQDALTQLGGSATLEIWRPPRAQLPVELAAALDRAQQTLSSLCTATGLDHRERTADARETAQALGLEPTTLAETLTEERRVHEVCVGARLSTPDGRSITLDLSDTATHERLRFRLALALTTLHRGAPPLIAVASDRPLISPAEALLDYQNQGHFAPGGADPYAPAREWLTAHGFELAHVDPREPKLPPHTDAFLLFQPRRNANALYTELFAHLATGGRALICAQQHEFLARRLSENDHAFAYWPRPLYPDLDGPPFTDLGLSIDPRLLFDKRSGTALLPTRIDRPNLPPHTELRPASEPFCIRVLGTADHGDLVLAGANALLPDAPRLAQRGLSLTPWLHAGPNTWAHAWEGGDLTPATLSGDLADPATTRHDKPPILAADLRGSFPTCQEDAEGRLHLQDPDTSTTGHLTLLGLSAPFRAAHLHAPNTDHAQLLLLALARLSLEPELVHLLSQRAAPRGFEPPAPAERLLWRLFLLGGFPLLLAVIGLRRTRTAA
jgi:hypothetical protein